LAKQRGAGFYIIYVRESEAIKKGRSPFVEERPCLLHTTNYTQNSNFVKYFFENSPKNYCF
jgi:hypothetical protein